MRACSIDGCDRRLFTSCLCSTHYKRRTEYGDPLLGPPIRRRSSAETLTEALREYTPTGLDPAQCWEWTGNINDTGYGRLCFGGKVYLAHRIAWKLYREERNLPAGNLMHVRHSCDNPPCVNPTDLVLGTIQQNLLDMAEKGRQARGERHGQAKLTEADVQAMRASLDSPSTLAARYGVAYATAHNAITGKTWQCVD